mgnify:CR=1 FL=1
MSLPITLLNRYCMETQQFIATETYKEIIFSNYFKRQLT